MFAARRIVLWSAVVVLICGLVIFAWRSSRVSAAYTCLNGGDHGGATWDPATDCPGGIAGVHTNISTLTIATGETATVQAYNGTQYGSVSISATSMSITGTLTANGKGYAGGAATQNGSGTGGGRGSGSTAGGAGYGGNGSAAGSGAAGGSAYGSYNAPTSLGSGGGGGLNSTGGNGGGDIQLTSTGTITINGTVTANGGNGTNNGGSQAAGGGSGGSIYITSATFAGTTGVITANGGGNTGAGTGGGNGGGGRIYISYTSSNTYSGTAPTVTAGSNGNGVAQLGTSLLVDATNNDLYIQTTQDWNANPSLEGQSFTYRNVTVSNNAIWNQIGYYTTNSNGVGMTFNVTSFTISAGAKVNLDGLGYAGGGSSANGSGPGPGIGSGSTGGGAGYGGNGSAAGSGAAGGSAYGSYNAPTSLGSGGGGGINSLSGNGGGAIKIAASGTVTINGTLSANGGNGTNNGGGQAGGGGSGGSIFITSGTFAGTTGVITANGGGNTGVTGAGNGGGGRIYISYTSSNTYTGATPTVTAGSNGNGVAQPGTSLLVDATNNDLYIQTTQDWNAKPSLEGQTFTYHSVTVTNNATWTLIGYYTTNTNGAGMTFNVTNFSVTAGSTANLSGQGYAGGGSSANGSGPGAGNGSGSTGGGGGYGGNGAAAASGAAGGTAYGSKLSPTDLGSGGGGGINSLSGGGGGAIKIAASGTVTVNGTLSANGGNGTNNGGGQAGGGGSGGSIFITTNTISGSGVISADGGSNAGTGAGGGGGGRIAIYYSTTYGWTGTTLDATHAASGGTGGSSGANGTVVVTHHAYATGNSITMSTSAAGGTGVSYKVVFTPVATTTVGGVVVDMCDDTPVFNSTTCAYPSSFNWGGATPSLTVNSGMGSGWTAAGVQGGAASGKSQVLELSNATPQSITAGTPLNFTITSATNPSSNNHSFYARIITFNTAGNMTSEYTVSGTTRSANLQDSLDHGGVALSTSAGISLSFQVPESLAFCVSGASMGSNCSGQTTPTIALGHAIGSTLILDGSQVDKANVYVQTSTNANGGVVVRIINTVSGATCGGLSLNHGVSCGIPAVNSSCGGSCSATTITAGTAAIGLCVSPGSGNITAAAPYNGANCGSTGTTYGLDDATATNVRSLFGSPVFSSSGVLSGENDTLVFAATASNTASAGVYSATYTLVATAKF